VPAQQQIGEHWYRGTADCVYQNLELIRTHRPKHVLCWRATTSTDGLRPDGRLSRGEGRRLTVGVVEVAREKAREFGVLSVTEWNRVTKFAEKPQEPEPIPGRPDAALASMGIYVFNARLMEKLLTEDANSARSKHDFGRNIIPPAIDKLQVSPIRSPT